MITLETIRDRVHHAIRVFRIRNPRVKANTIDVDRADEIARALHAAATAEPVPLQAQVNAWGGGRGTGKHTDALHACWTGGIDDLTVNVWRTDSPWLASDLSAIVHPGTGGVWVAVCPMCGKAGSVDTRDPLAHSRPYCSRRYGAAPCRTW